MWQLGKIGSGTAAAVSVALMIAGPALPASADTVAGGANNVVQVSATQGMPPMSAAHLSVAFDPGGTVANQNEAFASSSSCVGCVASAAAVQIVVVEGSPKTFVPHNAAVAANFNCTGCTTFAYAYQDVIQVPGTATLSGDAWEHLRSIAQSMRQVTASTATPAAKDAQLGALSAAAAATVQNGLSYPAQAQKTDAVAQDAQST